MAKTESIELIAIAPYRENRSWFMKLEYELRLSDGSIKRLVYPKVENPFSVSRIEIDRSNPLSGQLRFDKMLVNDRLCIFPGSVVGYKDADGNICRRDKCDFVEILVKKPDTREMTLAEIEKELGYPVKIVRGEE